MDDGRPRPMRLLATIAVMAALGGGGASSAAGEQILLNPGFEEAKGEQPAQWAANGPVSTGQPGHSGTSAVKLGNGGRVLQCFALDSGFAYHGSVWARGAGKLTLSFYEYKDGPGQNYAGGTATDALKVTQQWQQFHLTYSQGQNEAHLKGLCFALSAGAEGAEVTADDASVEKTPLPAAQPNLLLNPEFVDADGDGVPDHWQGEKRRLKIETGPGGGNVLRLAATLFSEDYQPDADFHDWWSWPRWGEQHGSGWPALPRPLGGAYTVLLESEPVAVVPGQRYDVRMLLRHLDVYGEFIAVRWLDADKKPTAEFEERIGYYYFGGHTSDWVAYAGRVTSAQVARFASVVVGMKLSSGAAWVAKPSLTFGLGAPFRHEPRSEWQAAEVKQGVPKAQTVTASTVRVPASGKPGVQVTESEIRIVFANGVALTMPLRDKRLIGITTVSCAGTPLRNPKAPPLSPLVETTPVRLYSECVYGSCENTKTQEGVILHSTLRTSKGEEDKLDWVLAPTSQTLAGRNYVGLRYGYRFSSDQVRVRRIMDRATWELGGTSQGLRVGSSLLPIGKPSTYCLEWAYGFVETECFHYQTSPSGTLVSFLDHYHTTLVARAATPDTVIVQDTFLFPEVRDAATTTRNVLFFGKPGAADDWAQIRDTLYARFRAQLGAPSEKPLQPAAMFIGYGGLRGIADLRPEDPNIKQVEYYRWVADKAVPRLAELGFKRVMMVLPRGPWNWPANDINNVCPDYVEPFKCLCDAAHERGMTVISWYGCVQNLDGAAVWKEHPEFILMGPNGQRARTYYSPWGWPGKLEAGFAQYTLSGLRNARERTGLDGLWLDSYSSATHLMDTADFGEAVRQADGLLPWQAAVEKMGYYTYCEGAPHCIGYLSTSGWEEPKDWSRFRPERYYKQGLYLQQPGTKSPLPYGISEMGRFLADPERRYYYRMVANLCCPILDMGHFGDDKAAIERIGQANHDFNAVSDLMQVRHLLGDRGVEWLSDGGRAVFAFEEMEYAVPRGLRVRDVTEGKAIRVGASGRVKLARYHTYRLTAR